jgi:hypothetical protein
MLSRQPSPRGGDLQLCSNRPLNDTHCASKVALPAQRSAGDIRICRWPGCRAAAETGGCPAATQRRRTEWGGARRSLVLDQVTMRVRLATDSIRWPIPGLHT